MQFTWSFISFFFVFPLILSILGYIIIAKPFTNKVIKVIIMLVIAMAAFKNIWLLALGGDVLAPDLPGNVIVFASMLFVWLIFALAFNFITRLVFFKFKYQTYLITLVSSIALGLSIIATINAAVAPEKIYYNLVSDKYDFGEQGLKIIQISDLHFGHNITAQMTETVVELVESENPDIILITGDLIDGKPEMSKEQLAILNKLSAPLGVYAINGNHEYYSNPKLWEAEWSKYNFKFLHNEHLIITTKSGKDFILVGVTDEAALKVPGNYEGPNIEKALEGVSQDDLNSLPIVLMKHQPKDFKYESNYVDLMLSGHTHGGMVIGINKIVALANDGFVSGLYKYNNSNLIVNNGTYLWSGFFARLGIPGEISVITLTNH